MEQSPVLRTLLLLPHQLSSASQDQSLQMATTVTPPSAPSPKQLIAVLCFYFSQALMHCWPGCWSPAETGSLLIAVLKIPMWLYQSIPGDLAPLAPWLLPAEHLRGILEAHGLEAPVLFCLCRPLGGE